MPLTKRPKKQVFDEGTYTIPKSDSKASIERSFIKGIKQQSFAFTMNGKVLKGRFAFKQARNTTFLQKFKDKYAVEEDVLSEDLARTIQTMVPDYDEKKVKLGQHRSKQKSVIKPKPLPVEEVTADKEIGHVNYHFAYYTSVDEQEICLITSENGEVLVLKKERAQWIVLPPIERSILKRKRAFINHCKALYDIVETAE